MIFSVDRDLVVRLLRNIHSVLFSPRCTRERELYRESLIVNRAFSAAVCKNNRRRRVVKIIKENYNTTTAAPRVYSIKHSRCDRLHARATTTLRWILHLRARSRNRFPSVCIIHAVERERKNIMNNNKGARACPGNKADFSLLETSSARRKFLYI